MGAAYIYIYIYDINSLRVNIVLLAWINEWLSVAWGPVKGCFATASHGLIQCREQCYE